MTIQTKPISVDYTDERLRILVEEYITMQKAEFTFKGVCSYVLYWAKEEGKTHNKGLYESDQLSPHDCERLSVVLKQIIDERRIDVATGNVPKDAFADDKQFVKVMVKE